jgi:hypothetical protein
MFTQTQEQKDAVIKFDRNPGIKVTGLTYNDKGVLKARLR